jgi:hypothetical protein
MRTIAKAATAAIITLATFAAHADDPNEQKRAELFKEGTQLDARGDYAGAADKFRQVIAIRSTPRALISLASEEQAMNHFVAAVRICTQARDDARANHSADDEAAAVEALNEMDKQLPHLAFNVPAGSTVQSATIDNATIASIDTDIPLDPGQHSVSVRSTDGRIFDTTANVTKGQRTVVDIVWQGHLMSEPFDASAHHDAPQSEDTKRGLPIGPIVVAGAGVLAAGVGAIFWAVGTGQQNDVENNQCNHSTTCPDSARGDADTAHSNIVLGNVLFGVGLGAIAVGGVWFLLSGSGSSSSPSSTTPPDKSANVNALLHIKATPTPGGGWLGYSAAF